MSITANYEGAGSPALIAHLAGISGQALDRLWEQRWIRESMEKGSSTPSRDAETFAGELRYKSDRIVVIASGLVEKMICAALTAFRDPEDSKEVICFGESLSAEDYTGLLTAIEDRNVGLIAVGLEEEPLAQKAAFATMRKILRDKYGPSGADRRTVIVASPKAPHLLQETGGEIRSCILPEDTDSAFASNTEALLIPLMAAGVSGAEYLDGFHEMVISTWWDADADQYSLHLSRYGAEDILYWQRELGGLAEWLAGMHRSIGIDAKTLFCPAELSRRRMKSSGDQISIDDLGEPEAAFATQLLVEREQADIMLPAFPGAVGDGSLNELLRMQAKSVLSPSLRERMKKGTTQDICGVRMTEVTPYEYGQMAAFLQISHGITQFVKGR